MHAEMCPICNGDGLICDIEPEKVTDACPRYRVCNGCQGKGWVSVPDTEREEDKETLETLSAVLPVVEESGPELKGEDTEEEEPKEPEFKGEDE